VSRYQKGKTIWILQKQEAVSGSGISWAVCKSAPHSRQITMPAPHHLVFTGPTNKQHKMHYKHSENKTKQRNKKNYKSKHESTEKRRSTGI